MKKTSKKRKFWCDKLEDESQCPGYIDSNTVMICDKGGRYTPMKHIKQDKVEV